MIPERYEAALPDGDGLLRATEKVESAFLGAVLTVGQMPKEPPRTEDFLTRAHQATWEAILAIAARGEAPDLTLTDYELSKTGRLDVAGGPGFLAMHLDSTDCSDLAVYARIVREAARVRRLNKLKSA